MEPTDSVRGRVELEAWKDLLGDSRSADHLPPLQNQHLEAGPAQVRGRHEAVVARADDDGVVRARHRGRSSRIFNAASLPDAPVIPPPGWVPDPTLVVVPDRCGEVGPSRRRAQAEELMQRQLPMEDVALSQAHLAVHIPRGQHLSMQDRPKEVWRILSQRIDDGVPERLALGLVPASVQIGRGVLDEDRHDVLPGRGHARIDHGGQDDVHVGPPGEPSVLGIVVCPLQVIDAGADGDGAAQVGAHAGEAREVGELAQGQVHLARRPPDLEAPDGVDEIVGKILGLDHLEEGPFGIQCRDHDGRSDLVPVLEGHTHSLAVLHDDLGDAGLRANVGAEAPRGPRDRLAYAAGPAPGEPPSAHGAVDLAQIVVQQHVRCAGGSGAEERADDPAGRHGGLQGLRLEPLVEVVGGAHGHELEEGVELLPPQSTEMLGQPSEPEEVLGTQGCRVGRHKGQDRLHRHRQLVHELAEVVVRVGVPGRVSVELSARLIVVRPAHQMVAILKRRERALEREDLQAVARQVQVPDDLRAQQAHHIGAHGVLEARVDLLRNGCAPRARAASPAPRRACRPGPGTRH